MNLFANRDSFRFDAVRRQRTSHGRKARALRARDSPARGVLARTLRAPGCAALKGMRPATHVPGLRGDTLGGGVLGAGSLGFLGGDRAVNQA